MVSRISLSKIVCVKDRFMSHTMFSWQYVLDLFLSTRRCQLSITYSPSSFNVIIMFWYVRHLRKTTIKNM